LLYLPTYSPWLNPIEMPGAISGARLTHCELYETMEALLRAALNFFNRFNCVPHQVRSIIGSLAAVLP
jgi:hypothetical protein